MGTLSGEVLRDPMGTSRIEKVGTLSGEVSRDPMGTSRVEKVGTLSGEVWRSTPMRIVLLLLF